MFFKKRSSRTTNVIDDSLAAKLVRVDDFPAAVGADADLEMSCTKVIAEGEPPALNFIARGDGEIYESGFLIGGLEGSAPFVFQNSPDPGFDVWQLVSDNDWSIARRLHVPQLGESQDEWVDFFALDAGCLLPGRVLLSIRYDDPTAEYALYLYDIEAQSYARVADASPEFQDPHRYFWIRRLGEDRALVLFYSGRTREAPEIYHNYYNHIMLFDRSNPGGRMLLTLGIDTGNVEDWVVVDETIYIKTVDHRGHGAPRRETWSLNISGALGD